MIDRISNSPARLLNEYKADIRNIAKFYFPIQSNKVYIVDNRDIAIFRIFTLIWVDYVLDCVITTMELNYLIYQPKWRESTISLGIFKTRQFYVLGTIWVFVTFIRMILPNHFDASCCVFECPPRIQKLCMNYVCR